MAHPPDRFPDRSASTQPDATRLEAGRLLQVRTRRGWPAQVRFGARRWTVTRIEDLWVVRGRWWQCDEERVYFALTTCDAHRLTICRARLYTGSPTDAEGAPPASPSPAARERWYLTGVWD